MGASFSGVKVQRMDAKGRIVIPASFRDTLRAGDPKWSPDQPVRLILNFGDHLRERDPATGKRTGPGCLRIHTYDSYEEIEATINAHPIGSRERRNLSFLYMTQREEMEIDKEGRIILGADLRRMLGLDEGEVKLLGMSDYLELWALDRFETGVGADVEDFLDNLAPGEDPLALPIAPRGG